MTTQKWNTEKGAQIELTVEHITKEMLSADGQEIEVVADYMQTTEFKMNGKVYSASVGTQKGQNVVNFKFNGQNALVAIPEAIYEAIFGEFNKRQSAKYEANRKADEEYYDHMNKINTIMNR